ncbi:MAG: Protein N-acetyltransferase, RimJ/RimL family [Chloroflexi bacterium AL-W]|nr:Protein N-acetyltransferase, RimJ/RimL family [Chloroflexi bacterium AL-N1]NOK65914.1 Protein N-acetyltransferase, RimJ/RimL family [Chloroflexi bacterium AL-N10]NOK72795.1 Protein N-acetyltransferase, RimJ/RimL family [Chloroflexi bacterium AL-N5]NOK79692.1 Protein N-acetyltransferase, RimJ/RimL family [Chloroflexi bacterium AL-W]NOK93017.1 Protein N-acetyltransferase, RimJ/RimL family [Chloroflexi bacterium AL-N15]
MFGPSIEGELIRLDPPKTAYAAIYIQWFADPQLTHYMLVRNPPSLRQEEEWLEQVAASPNDIIWAIVLRENGKLIGNIGLQHIEWRHRHSHSGTIIGDPTQWGKGYATEAIRLRTIYAFRELGLEKILTSVSSGNERSRRALERAGYKQCGLLRRNRFFHGRWHDEWLGEILRDEWETQQIDQK